MPTIQELEQQLSDQRARFKNYLDELDLLEKRRDYLQKSLYALNNQMTRTSMKIDDARAEFCIERIGAFDRETETERVL